MMMQQSYKGAKRLYIDSLQKYPLGRNLELLFY